MYRTLLLLVTCGLALPASLAAQNGTPPAPGRLFAGGTLLYAQPQGEFSENVNRGFGAAGHALFQLDRAGYLALRGDAGFVIYGSETKRVPFSSTVGGRIMVDVATTNNILFVSVGPQLMVPDGRLRPYVNAALGASYFYTESRVETPRDNRQIAQTTNQSDLNLSYGGGAGIYIPIRRGTSTFSLDLGARYLVNGQARYLREGSIRDEPDGSIFFTPIESDANFFTYHIGASFRLPNAAAARSPARTRPR